MNEDNTHIKGVEGVRKGGALPGREHREPERWWLYLRRLDVSSRKDAGFLWRVLLYFLWLLVMTCAVMLALAASGIWESDPPAVAMITLVSAIILSGAVSEMCLRLRRGEFIFFAVTSVVVGITCFLVCFVNDIRR